MRSLTAEQELAVVRRGEPLSLSAAAGSGKTSVLVERFVRAVREDGIAPGRILAITFTERAAGELRERVRARFIELEEREHARDTEAAFVGTFHGFCARLLRANAVLAGLDPDFTILEEGFAGRLRLRAFRVALAAFLAREQQEPAVDLLAAYGADRVQTMIAAVHAQLRSGGQREPRLPSLEAVAGIGAAAELDPQALATCALLDELLAGFVAAYERLKRERGALDFDDLELLARELLEHQPGVRSAWSERFELLMVDEFQDTNPRQLGILDALDRENLFTVGDELQSIYGFRYAQVDLFRARRDELTADGRSLALRSNFRSRAPLLELVNAIFAARFTDFVPLQAGREDEPESAAVEPCVELLLSARAGWEQNEELSAEIAAGLPAAPIWRQAEARALAAHVGALVDSGRAQAGEVVVLLRALGDLDVYERALQLRGLRTLAAVGGFWRHQQIGDLLAYLRVLANPLDEQALYATLASPLVGISRDGLALLALRAREQRAGAWETALELAHGELLAAGDRACLIGFCKRLTAERAESSRHTLSELIERALAATDYVQHVLGLEWGERRLANIHKLLRLARRFEAGEGRDLRGFLDHVEHLISTAGASESDAPVEGVEPDAVRLMSIHGAKGLEFPVVCVADLGRAPNTRMPDLLIDGPRFGLALVRLDGGKAMPTLEYEQLAAERRGAEAEEEDRILYVAMTRARERIVLSGAVDFERWPEPRQGGTPISWLGPTLSSELPELARAGVAGVHDLAVGPDGRAAIRCHFNTAVAPLADEPAATRVATPSVESATEPSAPGSAARDAAAGDHEARAPAYAGASTAQTGTALPAGIATLSYTSLSELERCGYRYYLERVLGLSEDRAAARAQQGVRGAGARARGTLVHRLLELLDFAAPKLVSAEQIAALARELGMRLTTEESAQLEVLIATAAQAPLAQRIVSAVEIRREHPFAFTLENDGALVTGVIDLLAREADGGYLVIDYKSDQIDVDLELEAYVEQEYAVQRLLYALAVLREGTERVTVVHWFLERPDQPVQACYTAHERARLEGELGERLACVQERGFSVSARPHRGLCLTCPGRAGLCSWDESQTLREAP